MLEFDQQLIKWFLIWLAGTIWGLIALRFRKERIVKIPKYITVEKIKVVEVPTYITPKKVVVTRKI